VWAFWTSGDSANLARIEFMAARAGFSAANACVHDCQYLEFSTNFPGYCASLHQKKLSF
jgi:hypothetical protein